MNKEERLFLETRSAMSVKIDLELQWKEKHMLQIKECIPFAFEIWSIREGIQYSYYENPNRNQVLTEKVSSMPEQNKMVILSNELKRLFLMMDDLIEDWEKVEKLIGLKLEK